jgi:uncharacterized protein YerC
MKRKADELSKEERMQTLDMLYTTIAHIKGREDMKLFLRDLLTESERIMLGRRIQIARLLLAGISQAEVMERLHVGPNTVWRVEKWLNDQFPGYEKALAGLEKEMDKRALARERKDNPFGYATLKKKYPLHFLLFPEPKPKKKYRS